MLDRRMQKLASIYARLFAKWGADPATKTRLLDLVRDREERTLDTLGDGFEGGVHGLAESWRAVRRLRDLYSVEILAVLGPEKAAELSALDAAVYADRPLPRAQPD